MGNGERRERCVVYLERDKKRRVRGLGRWISCVLGNNRYLYAFSVCLFAMLSLRKTEKYRLISIKY